MQMPSNMLCILYRWCSCSNAPLPGLGRSFTGVIGMDVLAWMFVGCARTWEGLCWESSTSEDGALSQRPSFRNFEEWEYALVGGGGGRM
eukprot:jgi/Botrbrau1/13269/Bobra.0074s0017.1